MNPWITDDTLGEALDDVIPLDLKGCAQVEPWFFYHPDWQYVFCKYGYDTKGRFCRLWMRLARGEGPDGRDIVVLLTIEVATDRERHVIEEADHADDS